MTGNFVDHLRFRFKTPPAYWGEHYRYLDTDYGKIRVFDTQGTGPVILNVPDGPNVIEHQRPLIEALASRYRVICFEFPGVGFSYPSARFDYSFAQGAGLLEQVLDMLKVPRAALLFSCSNGFYALRAAEQYPDRLVHLFLSQTPSIAAIRKWTERAIPRVLRRPVIGQLVNAALSRKFAATWYKYALPKDHPAQASYTQIAHRALDRGGCFCLASLVHGLQQDAHSTLTVNQVPTTLVWGSQDFTHRHTAAASIQEHVPNCEIIPFETCGHFPELESTRTYVRLIQERLA